ncbi:MAG: hypothetical protein WC548_00045 [Candidatus Pacearchaeota archaeon]
MGVQVREKSVEEIRTKLLSMQTALNKITYLESALREIGLTYEIKRFIWGELGNLYGERIMYEKAAKAMMNKAAMEVSPRTKIDNYISAAEYFSRAGRVDDADEMFNRASRDSSPQEKIKINLAKKNIYLVCATELEKKGKRASAVKFFEKLMKMNLEEFEKVQIKEKLLSTYKALGHFREAKLIEGM